MRQQFSGKETIREVELVEGRGHPGQKTWILKFGGIDTVEEVSLARAIFSFVLFNLSVLFIFCYSEYTAIFSEYSHGF